MRELEEAIEHAKKVKGESDAKNGKLRLFLMYRVWCVVIQLNWFVFVLTEPISSFIGAVNTQIEGGTNVNEGDDSWEVESRNNIRRGIKAYDPQDKLRKEAGKIIQ